MTLLLKVGHFTMDNASNNGTMMQWLEKILGGREIAFDAQDRRIMCFAHIVDLCSKQVVSAASGGVDEENDHSSSDGDTGPSNPIVLARAVVRAIRGSGLRRDAFDEVIKNGNDKGWFKEGRPLKIVKVKQQQLLRDVRTRWDSVYKMLTRLRDLRPVWLSTSPITLIPAK
jgi:hypothetical protein